jgi:hypothetical protein
MVWTLSAFKRLTARRYHDFLETFLLGLLEVAPLTVSQVVWFEHDEAPVRYAEVSGGG